MVHSSSRSSSSKADHRCRGPSSPASICWLLVLLGTAALASPLQQSQPDISQSITASSQHSTKLLDPTAGISLPFKQRRVSARHGGESARLRRWTEALDNDERDLFHRRARRLRRRTPVVLDDDQSSQSSWRRWFSRSSPSRRRNGIDLSQEHDDLLRERELEVSILVRRQQTDIVQDLWNLDDAR